MDAGELRGMLAISEASENDEIFLLNPSITTDEGEWEALVLSDHLPGAQRYRTFRRLMEAELEHFRSLARTCQDGQDGRGRAT